MSNFSNFYIKQNKPETSGKALQYVSNNFNIGANNTITLNETVLTFSITPESSNSTFEFATSFKIHESDGDNVKFAVYVDGVKVGDEYAMYRDDRSVGGVFQLYGRQLYNNTSTASKTITIRAAAVSGTPTFNTGSDNFYAYTEVQN